MVPSSQYQLFVVSHRTMNAKFITWAYGRDDAIRRAADWVPGIPSEYIVEPITNPGDRVKLEITLNV